jgi:hypothetical protein
MEALQKPGRIAGLWFLGTFVFSIPAALLYGPVLNDPNYILGEGLDARIALGALLEILLAISNIATAVVFFPVLKRVNEAVALGYVASRTIESAIIVMGLISLMSVVTLRQNFTGTTVTPPRSSLPGRRWLLSIAGRSFSVRSSVRASAMESSSAT